MDDVTIIIMLLRRYLAAETDAERTAILTDLDVIVWS